LDGHAVEIERFIVVVGVEVCIESHQHARRSVVACDSTVGIATLVALSSPWVVVGASVEGPASAIGVVATHLAPHVHIVNVETSPFAVP
jgi:hypothetical protein